MEWKRKIKERLTPARDIGVYNAYGKEGWNDELLMRAKESEPEGAIEALVRDAEVEVQKGGEESGETTQEVKKEVIQKPLPRITEADRTGDTKNLDRSLQRTLYLLVRNGEKGKWWFPSDGLVGRESLHTVSDHFYIFIWAWLNNITQAAERIIVHAGGVNMNTWVVGNIPLGHFVLNYSKSKEDKEKSQEFRGEKFFFMKGRIMAGQANLENNKLGLTDFQWLAKDEIQKLLTPQDWNAVKNILAER